MVDVFENAVSILIHDKDVQSIKTLDGTVVWEKPVQTTTILVFSGDTVSFGQNIDSNGDVTVDWGDGTTTTINNPTSNISHTYSDGETTHTVILDGRITNFGEGCFYSSTLSSITIPNSVTSLGGGCFANCTGLTSITIPNSVTSLGNDCFVSCTISNYQLYWVNDDVITYNTSKMPTTNNTVFTIPNNSTEDYVAKGYPSDKLVERSE